MPSSSVCKLISLCRKDVVFLAMHEPIILIILELQGVMM